MNSPPDTAIITDSIPSAEISVAYIKHRNKCVKHRRKGFEKVYLNKAPPISIATNKFFGFL